MAFRPSKRPSSSASRREQRKASGNAALNAGRYQGIPSYDNDPDPVPVTLPTRGSSGLTGKPLGGDPFAPTRDARGYIPYREPTLKPTINSYGQQLLNTNSVNRVTGKGIASLANTWRDNPLINYNRNNPSSLLRTIVNYPANVATNLFKSIPGAATTLTGLVPDLLLGRGTSEKTRADIAENLGTEVMSYLESTMGSPKQIFNFGNLGRYAKTPKPPTSLKEALDTSNRLKTVGGITGSNPNLNPFRYVTPSSKSPAVFDYKNADIAVNAARKADSKLTSPVKSYFTTGKGSQYAVLENGQTIRFKAPRKGLLHEGQSGPQIPSSKTVFVDQKGSDVMLDFQRNSSQMGMNISQEVLPLANNKAHVVYLEDFGKFKKGDAVPNSTFSYTLKPETGKSPLEIMDGGRSAHIGTKITDTRIVGGGGSLSAPTVRTLKPDEKMARDILDRGSDITTSEVQILNKINPSSKKFIDEDYERSFLVGDPMASRSPLQRDLKRELRVREEIAKILNLDRSHPAVIERAQSIIGKKPTTVYHGRSSDVPRLEGRPNQYTSTNPAVARTYGDTDTFFGYKKPGEFFFMADPNKGGVRIDARGATWNKIPGDADVRYQGGLNSLDEYTGSTWMQSTDEAYNALRNLKPKPNSIQMENIIDPKSLLTQNSSKYLGDNFVTTNSYSLRNKDALMLPQFKKLPGYAYRGGGIVSLLK